MHLTKCYNFISKIFNRTSNKIDSIVDNQKTVVYV